MVLLMLSMPWRRSARTTVPARLTTAALLGSAVTVAALVATDIVPVPSWALPGVDIASHQHPNGAAIDWKAVKASGQSYAFIKATEGVGYLNPFFSSDSFKAQEAGVVPGSYHYAKPSYGSARAQARYYATALATGPQPSLPPVLDLEENGGLDPVSLQNWVRDWIDEIKKQTGRDPIMYTYYSFWIDKMANTTEFSQYPLWLAYYNQNLPSTIPGGWKSVTFWQYSDSGNVNGIRGNVDLNEYYGSDAQLKQLASGSPSGTLVGNVSEIVEPIRDATDAEADVINEIEHATGVDIPLTTDFLMLLLGVAGGRLGPEVLVTQGLGMLQGSGALSSSGADSETTAGTADAAKTALPALLALANALQEVNASGKPIPVDALIGLASNGNSVQVSQLLGILKAFGGTQDWNAKLNNGEVPADPEALQRLSEAADAVQPAPAGTPLPPEAVDTALANLNQ